MVAQEIKQPQLATYSNPPWFYLNTEKTGVIFSANWDGETTSGSSNPRSELREMVNDGNTLANWDGAQGRHQMDVEFRVTRLDGLHHVVVGQIHDASDDVTVFRLEGTQLWITDGDNPHGYFLGTYTPGPDSARIKVGFDVFGGEVHYRYQGNQVGYTHPIGSGCYFKFGAYLQRKQDSGGATVEMFSLKVVHS